MLKTESAIDSLLRPIKLNQRLDQNALVLSSQQIGWNGIFVEQYQDLLNSRKLNFLPHQIIGLPYLWDLLLI